MCKKKECIFWIELVHTGKYVVRKDDSWQTYIILKSMNIHVVTFISMSRAALYHIKQEKAFIEKKKKINRGQTHWYWFLREEHYNRGRKRRQSKCKGMIIGYELKHIKDNLFYSFVCVLIIECRLLHLACRSLFHLWV